MMKEHFRAYFEPRGRRFIRITARCADIFPDVFDSTRLSAAAANGRHPAALTYTGNLIDRAMPNRFSGSATGLRTGKLKPFVRYRG